MCNFTREIINSRRENIWVITCFWGASGFFGGPVDFLIHWPPGPVVATVQCQGLYRLLQVCPQSGSDILYILWYWSNNNDKMFAFIFPGNIHPCCHRTNTTQVEVINKFLCALVTYIFRAYVFSSSVCSCSMSTVKNPVLLANLYWLPLTARNQCIMSTVWSIIATQHQDRALEDDDVVATLNEPRSWPEAVNNQINGQLIQGQRKSIPQSICVLSWSRVGERGS